MPASVASPDISKAVTRAGRPRQRFAHHRYDLNSLEEADDSPGSMQPYEKTRVCGRKELVLSFRRLGFSFTRGLDFPSSGLDFPSAGFGKSSLLARVAEPTVTRGQLFSAPRRRRTRRRAHSAGGSVSPPHVLGSRPAPF